MEEVIKKRLTDMISKIYEREDISLEDKSKKIVWLLEELDKTLHWWHIKLSTWYKNWYDGKCAVKEALRSDLSFDKIVNLFSNKMVENITDKLLINLI